MSFVTNIVDPGIEKVIALSDIHGDIQAFIIALRDCAKVITKKEGFEFTNDTYDINLENELIKNLNDVDINYIQDLNYNWIGGNTHVVICGDIIDPHRTNICKKDNNLPCHYYPQIELKILMFINAINKQARGNGGQIIKLLGNHELGNILEETNHYDNPDNYDQYGNIEEIRYSGKSFTSRYAHPIDIKMDNYYNNQSRLDIFNVGNHGFDLLFEGGCGILVKINNVLFVHGGLANKPYSYFNNHNQWINNLCNRTQKKWNNKLLELIDGDPIVGSPLWVRVHQHDNYSSRIINKNKGKCFCDNTVVNEFRNFCKDLPDSNEEDIQKLKLVVGHCIQSTLTTLGYFTERGKKTIFFEGITYSNKINNDEISEIYSNPTYSGKATLSDRNTIFGITMECPISPEHNNHKIYKVDVGSSRGFDTQNNSININLENKFFYSRTPQVLVIKHTINDESGKYDDQFSIIKSKMKNTRIHLPRPKYEDNIRQVFDLKLVPSNKKYDKKYLKYKNKYLLLQREKI